MIKKRPTTRYMKYQNYISAWEVGMDAISLVMERYNPSTIAIVVKLDSIAQNNKVS